MSLINKKRDRGALKTLIIIYSSEAAIPELYSPSVLEPRTSRRNGGAHTPFHIHRYHRAVLRCLRGFSETYKWYREAPASHEPDGCVEISDGRAGLSTIWLHFADDHYYIFRLILPGQFKTSFKSLSFKNSTTLYIKGIKNKHKRLV